MLITSVFLKRLADLLRPLLFNLLTYILERCWWYIVAYHKCCRVDIYIQVVLQNDEESHPLRSIQDGWEPFRSNCTTEFKLFIRSFISVKFKFYFKPVIIQIKIIKGNKVNSNFHDYTLHILRRDEHRRFSQETQNLSIDF